MTRSRLVLALAVTLIAAAVASAEGPTTPWQRLYLEGIRLESERQWRPAMDRFERAASLHPEPEAGVGFGPVGELDYDPYVHLARCALESDAPAFVVRRALERSARAGVTPRADLKRLAEQLARKSPAGRLAERALPSPTEPPTPEAEPSATAVPTIPPTPTPSVGRIRFPDLPEQAAVALDGRALPAGTAEAEVGPGGHHVVIAVGGVTLVDLAVEVAAGETVTVIAAPTDAPGTASPTVTPTAPPVSATPPPRRTWTALGPRLATIAAAAAVLAAAGLVLAMGRRRRRRALEITPTERMPGAPPPAGSGREVGPYRLLERLGAGGMATTWRAVRSSDGREVAVKLPHEHCLDDPRFRARFLREGRLGTQLHHPNIVRLLDAGEDDGQPYLAMELVRGRTLRDLLAAAGALPVERSLEVARQVAEALDYAHSKGVVHRDLKPENLMTRPDATVLVMDFGIARVEDGGGLTTTSVFMGTPTYAAPEAIAGEPCDGRQDLYALGLILYEMLAGSPPFTETTPLELLKRHVDGPPPDRARLGRAVPDPVWAVIERLTARRPEHRFPHAEALLVELNAVRRDLE